MRSILMALLLAAILAATAAAGAATPATPAMPFKSGTVWTYRVLKTESAGGRTVATRTTTYKGMATYRGQSYHVFETRDSLGKGVERDMVTWTGTMFRQAATVVMEGKNTTETVFDKPYATSGASEALSGRTDVYQNGELTGRIGWSNVVSKGKTQKVTVPAGTFTATRWEGALVRGNLKQVYTMYAVGPVEVRTDMEVFDKGVRQASIVIELTKGPVGK